MEQCRDSYEEQQVALEGKTIAPRANIMDAKPNRNMFGVVVQHGRRYLSALYFSLCHACGVFLLFFFLLHLLSLLVLLMHARASPALLIPRVPCRWPIVRNRSRLNSMHLTTTTTTTIKTIDGVDDDDDDDDDKCCLYILLLNATNRTTDQQVNAFSAILRGTSTFAGRQPGPVKRSTYLARRGTKASIQLVREQHPPYILFSFFSIFHIQKPSRRNRNGK